MSIRASVRFSLLRAKLRANMLRLASRVGRFLFIRRFYETLSTTEEHSAEVDKPRADEAASNDFQFAHSDKPLENTAVAGESHSANFDKLRSDDAASEDAQAVETYKPISSGSLLADDQSVDFTKARLDVSQTSDYFYRQIAFIRGHTDSSSAAEAHLVSLSRPDLADGSATADDDTWAFTKSRSDGGVFTDTLEPWTLTKAFYEMQDYALDYFAEEYVVVNGPRAAEAHAVTLSRPNIADVSAVAESSSWLAEKPFSETPSVADTFQPWTLFKALGDNCTSCDEFAGQSVALDNDVQSVGKVLTTRAGTTERSFYELGRLTADPASVASESSYALSRPDLADSANGADITQKRFERAFTEIRDYVEPGYSEDDYAFDSPRAAESLVFAFGGVAADTAGAASQSVYALNRPDLADALSVAEFRASDLTRLVIDAGAATSIKAIDLAKPESDNPALADTGELVNQGYVNSFYFAEDYVGVRQTI